MYQAPIFPADRGKKTPGPVRDGPGAHRCHGPALDTS